MTTSSFGPYEVISRLGAGGMGEVYLARDTRLGRKVAIKLLPPELSGDASRRQRFLREARAASALNHPNICTIHEIGETADDRPYLAMEYVDGQTLAVLVRTGAVPIRTVLDIAIQVADALEIAHLNGVVHRDIKPANICRTERGMVKVLDFGLAKHLADETASSPDASTMAQTGAGQILGTPAYMSPEQALCKTVDRRSDIFSLGAVLYELASGSSPFAAATLAETIERVLHVRPDRIRRLHPAVPEELEQIIFKCLEKDTGDRFQSACELGVELKKLARQLDSSISIHGERQSAERASLSDASESDLQSEEPGKKPTSNGKAAGGHLAKMLDGIQNVCYVRQVRLVAGIVLLIYVILHFSNHALGLISLEAMEVGRKWFLAFWRSPIGTVALYGAIAVHAILALWLLYQRPSLRMPLWEFWQYVFGLALPPLLAGHVVFTRISWWQYGTQGGYSEMLLSYWVLSPSAGLRQSLVLILAWIHGCIGLHFWLRFRPWYSKAKPWLVMAAVLFPILALAGFVAGGRELVVQARNFGWVEAQMTAKPPMPPEHIAALEGKLENFVKGYLLAIMGVFAARGLRAAWQRRRSVRVRYPGGRVVTVPVGFTILDASRQNGIPHASVCGGRGRCSTCRVLVVDGLEALPPASGTEKEVLASVRAAPDVRLACQTRPVDTVTIMPLLRASNGAQAVTPDIREGREQKVAVLFVNLHDLTRLTEKKLPYDTVYILNRYFEAVGNSVSRAGGKTSQFTGDGVMALFGLDEGPQAGCRHALAAVRTIIQEVGRLSSDMAFDFAEPLRVGMGLHVGPAVIGKMGWKDAFSLTAIGDTVHIAMRLEQTSKDHNAELVVSEDVAQCLGTDLSAFPAYDLSVRDQAIRISARIIPRVATLLTSSSSAPLADK